MHVTEMHMFHYVCGISKKYGTKNEDISCKVGVRNIGEMWRGRVKWFGHVMHRDEESLAWSSMRLQVAVDCDNQN